MGLLLTVTIVGLAAGQEGETGVGVIWILMGPGLSATCLLYRVLVALERI